MVIDGAEMGPVHLGLLPRWCLEALGGYLPMRFPIGVCELPKKAPVFWDQISTLDLWAAGGAKKVEQLLEGDYLDR